MSEYFNQFVKIKLLSDMSTAVAGYGESCGISKLMEAVDMNCGAIQDGPFESVVDQNCPEPFLKMYAQIAVSRFAFVVTNLVKINSAFLTPIEKFCYETGIQNQIFVPENLQKAFALIDSFILDSIEGNVKKILVENSKKKISWKYNSNSVLEVWKKSSLNDIKIEEIYRKITENFANGLLKGTNYKFQILNNEIFEIVCYS